MDLASQLQSQLNNRYSELQTAQGETVELQFKLVTSTLQQTIVHSFTILTVLYWWLASSDCSSIVSRIWDS